VELSDQVAIVTGAGQGIGKAAGLGLGGGRCGCGGKRHQRRERRGNGGGDRVERTRALAIQADVGRTAETENLGYTVSLLKT
jgi:NAD(P)-dependent dehydrogenase (short-subunit alcohol dehydrogenase family)